jgi:hypothetical protein
MVSTELRSLADRWRLEAEHFRQFEANGQAATCEQLATELDAALAAWDLSPLTISEASELSGYTEDHLRRLVRRGHIPNAGRQNSPRISRRDLPVKPNAKDGSGGQNPIDFREQIARSVANSEQGGSDG